MISTPPSASEIFTNIQGLQDIRQEKNDSDALKKVSQQFESMFVNMMMKSMRNANAALEEGSLFQSNETKFYRDMYDQQLSLSLSHGKGIGIAQTLYRQMSQQYGYETELEATNKKQSSLPLPASTNASKAYNIDPHRMGKSLSKNYRTGMEHESAIHDNVHVAVNQNFSSQSPKDFINSLLPFAQASSSKIGVDPHVLIAQSALETGWGRSVIQDASGQSSNNLFNIKANGHWQGKSVTVETKEYIKGKPQTELASFRQYSSIRQSFEDFIQFITDNPRYQKALNMADNAYDFTKELQRAGYATDPNYADKINSIYQRIKSALSVSGSAVKGAQP